MMSTTLRHQRNSQFIQGETTHFCAYGGNASWDAYQVFMKTGCWNQAKIAQQNSTLSQDFALEDEKILDLVYQKTFEEPQLYEEDSEIGFYDEEYEKYSNEYEYDDGAPLYNSDDDSPTSGDDDYFSS